VVVNEQSRVNISRPTFDSSPHLREKPLQEEHIISKEMEVGVDPSHPKVTHIWELGKCMLQTNSTPRDLISLDRVGENTQFMKEHMLIGKCQGLWSSERDLMKLIKTWWNPERNYELHLGLNGFFTIILYNLEDKDKIFENGPYFFNSGGLYLRFWTDCFNPKKEEFSYAPVWIRLYSLPH
jgi:hypothetical protein